MAPTLAQQNQQIATLLTPYHDVGGAIAVPQSVFDQIVSLMGLKPSGTPGSLQLPSTIPGFGSKSVTVDTFAVKPGLGALAPAAQNFNPLPSIGNAIADVFNQAVSDLKYGAVLVMVLLAAGFMMVAAFRSEARSV